MNARIARVGLLFLMAVAGLQGAETFDDAMKKATEDYTARLRTAADELNQTRRRIADEKAPLLREMRAAEDRIVAAQTQIERIQTGDEESADDRRKLLADLDAVRKNTTYIATLAHDTLKGFVDGLAPGEGVILSDRTQALEQALDDPNAGADARTGADVAEFLLERTQQERGGYAAGGSSLMAEDNQVVHGTFAFTGPETFFLPDSGRGHPGPVRLRAGAPLPVAYAYPAWKPEDAAAFFQGQTGVIWADASGGKALRLKETTGSVLQHIQKGGVVAYAILAVGLLSLVMIGQKLKDLSELAVDSPSEVQGFLAAVACGDREASGRKLASLKQPVRELFAVGLRQSGRPKAVLEEHLQSVLLRQRLHFERRLPLLAVIATAAPLMGLLGTVVGMVKTFALITVFGTGNAGKLASGISEVLVATELGLVVAIPTLIAHGFLAHRIQKNLSLLERYALEFITASESSRDVKEPLPV